MKTYTYSPKIGRARHCVSHHDGVKTHPDGSPFFDMEICRNLHALSKFVKRLEQDGYVPA